MATPLFAPQHLDRMRALHRAQDLRPAALAALLNAEFATDFTAEQVRRRLPPRPPGDSAVRPAGEGARSARPAAAAERVRGADHPGDGADTRDHPAEGSARDGAEAAPDELPPAPASAAPPPGGKGSGDRAGAGRAAGRVRAAAGRVAAPAAPPAEVALRPADPEPAPGWDEPARVTRVLAHFGALAERVLQHAWRQAETAGDVRTVGAAASAARAALAIYRSVHGLDDAPPATAAPYNEAFARTLAPPGGYDPDPTPPWGHGPPPPPPPATYPPLPPRTHATPTLDDPDEDDDDRDPLSPRFPH